MSDGVSALQQLFSGLAELFDGEDRPGAQAAAEGLRSAPISTAHERPNPYAASLTPVLQQGQHPMCQTILGAMPFIRWGPSDLGDGRIPDAIATQMPMCELLGPDGLVPHSSVRVGLWMQQPGVVYGPRRHAAEETFLIFAGHALWSTETSPPTAKAAGTVVHHPSNILHTSETGASAVLAAWRWSGDIGFDAYALTS